MSRAVFFCLPLAYSLTFARYWLSDVDEGFLLGLAWRVVNGELPHADFVYVRPSLSVLLQTVPLLALPESLVLIASRVGFYAEVAAYSFAASHLLVRAFGGRAARIDLWLLAAASFVFSAHEFPPMLWHTTDGLLFGTLGLTALWHARAEPGRALGSLCLVLAAATKQPYYALAALGPVYAGALHGRRAAVSVLAWTALWVAGALGVMGALGVLPAFLSQSAGGLGRGGGLVRSGVLAYLAAPFSPAVVAAGLAALASHLLRRRGRELDPGATIAAALLALFALTVAQESLPSQYRRALVTSYWAPHAFLLLGAGVVALEAARGRPDVIVLAALLFLAWLSGVTWGAQGPSLFAPPMLFALLYLAAERLRSLRVRELQWLLVAGGAAVFATLFFGYPRGLEPGARYPTVDLGSVSPKLAHVRGSEYTARKYRELLAARARYGDRLAVLPSLPLAYWVLGSRNPLPLELVRALELGGQEAWFARALDESADWALLETIFRRPDGAWQPEVVDRVRQTWTHVESLEAFEVYRNPRLAAPEVDDALDHPERGQRADRVGGE